MGIDFHELGTYRATLIENCTFTNNWYAIRRANNHSGERQSIGWTENYGSGQPQVVNCTFENNSIASLQLPENDGKLIDLRFESCDFIDNNHVHVTTVPNNPGGVELLEDKWYDHYEDCYFESNSTVFKVFDPGSYPDDWFWNGTGWPTDWEVVTNFVAFYENWNRRYGIQNNCYFRGNTDVGCTDKATNCLFVGNSFCHGAIRVHPCIMGCLLEWWYF